MAHNVSKIKKRTFAHLSEIERGEIAAYLDAGLSLRELEEG